MDNKEQAKQILTKLISEAFLQNFREQRDKEERKEREVYDNRMAQKEERKRLEREEQELLRERMDKEEYAQRLADERRNSGITTDGWIDEDTVEYTYKPGDTFGQVIKNLGLGTSNGLWGGNGDVEYYSQQLMNQGVWPNGIRGNIPIGTTIRLKRRK